MAGNAFTENDVIIWGPADADKTLVFLHYFGGSADTWQWVAQGLKRQYRCMAVNLPGFGGTKPLETPSVKNFAQHTLQLLKSLQVEKYTLIGHSMGGKVAMQMAADAPVGSIQQLILLAPSPPTFEDVPEQEKQQMLVHPSAEAAVANIKKNSVQPLTTDMFELAAGTNYMVDGNTWRWWIEHGMTDSIAADVAGLQMPVTVIASKDDQAITPKMIKEQVMPNLKGARLIETQGFGHLYPLEGPVWVAELLAQLVK